MEAFLRTQAEGEIRKTNIQAILCCAANKMKVQDTLLRAFSYRLWNAENALDAAQAEARRLREQCCLEDNGACPHA